MRKIKVLSVLIAVLMLVGVYFSSAFALGDAIGALGEYFGISGGTTSPTNPVFNDDVTTAGNEQVDLSSGFRSILEGIVGDAVNRLTSSELMSVLNQVDINELLGGNSEAISEVLDLIGSSSPTTGSSNEGQNGGQNGNSQSNSQSNSQQSSSQQNNVPQYTNVYVTEAPAVTYSYSGATAAVTTTLFGAETTTGVGETTSLSYIAPSTVYAEQITTLPFGYSVEDTEAKEKEGVTMKMVLGIAILLISAVAVVGVALSLKKSRV